MRRFKPTQASIDLFENLFEVDQAPKLSNLQRSLLTHTFITTNMLPLINDRYKTNWYTKKANQNRTFRVMLMSVIRKHTDKKFPYDVKLLRELPYSDLAEIAVAAVNKKLTIILGKGMDLSDKSDVKCVVSQYRNNKKEDVYGYAHWMHSYSVTGVSDKEGALRVVAFNELAKEFEFFFIPYSAYSRNMQVLEVVIERKSIALGESPNFTGSYKDSGIYCKWYQYKCASFEDMALRK